jgi:hypothetical protein
VCDLETSRIGAPYTYIYIYIYICIYDISKLRFKVTGGFPLRMKKPDRNVDVNSVLSTSYVKMTWSNSPISPL